MLRATTACNFSSHMWPAGSAPAALASLLFDPPEPQVIGKTQCFATFLPFRAPGSSFFRDFLFLSLLLLFSDSSHFCFSSVHIVRSLTCDFKTFFDQPISTHFTPYPSASICTNPCQPYQFISFHISPYQSISTHINPFHSKSLHNNPYQSISTHFTPYHSVPIHINSYQPISLQITPYQSISTHINPFHSKSLHNNPYQSISTHYTTLHITPYQSISIIFNPYQHPYQPISLQITPYQSISTHINSYQSPYNPWAQPVPNLAKTNC